MSLRVAHIVSSARPLPGSVAVCLPGLVDALRKGGIDSTIAESAEAPKTDVVHVHGWNDEPSRAAVASLAKSRRRFVLSPLGGLSTGPHNRWRFQDRLRFTMFRRKQIRAARALVAVNSLESNRLSEEARHSHVVVLPYGTTAAKSEPLASAARQPKRLLYLASLHPRFGCVALLLAIAELGPIADDWTVEIAASGDAKWRMKLEAAIRRKGAENRVRFVAAEDLPAQEALLQTASLLVAPTLHYDAGVSILQATALGVPVVATAPTLPAGLEGCVTTCEPNRDAIRGALHKVLSASEAERHALGRRGYEAVRGALDWSVLAPRYAALYEEVAHG